MALALNSSIHLSSAEEKGVSEALEQIRQGGEWIDADALLDEFRAASQAESPIHPRTT